MMAWLGALAALPEEQVLFPVPTWWLPTLTPVPGDPLLASTGTTYIECTDIHAGTHVHRIK